MPRPELLDVPPAEAVEHFRAKGYHVGFDWRDTAAAEHLASFTVAKAMRLDILADVRDAVDAAIDDGLTFRQFRERLEPTLRRKGWWGATSMVDPRTGERRVVQLGSLHRLRTIFDTNIRMAIARGRWERIERMKDRLPYLRYVGVLDSRTRPDHARWHGTVLPVDHPWWRTHMPPNGWRCRCLVVQLGEDDVRRHGGVSAAPVEISRPWTNRRTGETVQVPVGIDPGFAHNPGTLPAVRAARRVYRDKLGAASSGLAATVEAWPRMLADAIAELDALPHTQARNRVREMMGDDAFRAHAAALVPGDWPVAAADMSLATALGTTARAVRFSGWNAAKQLYRHPNVDAADYSLVQAALDGGTAFLDDRSLVAFHERDGRWWRAVVKATDEELYLVSLHRVEVRQLDRAARRWPTLAR